MILIAGCAGFIGYHVTNQLLSLDYNVIGVDNLNDYYDPSLKEARLHHFDNKKRFQFENIDISNLESVKNLFNRYRDIEKLST